MKTLVVYYSRTGNTRKVAERIAAELKASVEELKEGEDRQGIAGYLKSGFDAMRKKTVNLSPPAFDPGEFDMVILGTPVWAFTMVPAMRAYLEQNRGKFRDIAFFCTMGGSGQRRTFREMRKITGRTPQATLAITETDVKKDAFGPGLSDFISKFM